MRRIALLVLPLFMLTACEQSLPTAAEFDAPALAVTLDGEVTTVNLYTATTVQVVVPSVSTVPATATLKNEHNGAVAGPMHTFDAGCTTHFVDVDSDTFVDLILHFSVDELFGDYDTADLPADFIPLTLAVAWEDGSTFDAGYSVQLVFNAPKGFQGGR